MPPGGLGLRPEPQNGVNLIMVRIVLRRLDVNAKVAAVIVLAGTGLAGCGSLADVGGEDITKATSGGLSTILGVKAPEEQNRDIVLRARSPLVLPPDYALRPPVSEEQEKQQLGAAWPDDPDEKAKQLAALEAEKQAVVDERDKDKIGRSRAMTPEELQQGATPPPAPGTIYSEPRENASRAMSPEELLRRHRERASAQQQAQVQQQDPQTGQQQQAQATQQQSEQAAEQQPKEEKGFFDRLVFWN